MQKAITISKKDTALWSQSLSFIADKANVIEHYHYCYKVVVSLDNSFDCIIDGEAYFKIKGFIINQSIMHSCFAPDAAVLVNFVEIDSILGSNLKALLDGKAWVDLAEIFDKDQFNQVLPANYKELSNQQLIPHVDTFLQSLQYAADTTGPKVMDERIQMVVDLVEQNIQDEIEIEAFAKKIQLSLGRTRHLFMEEMGVSFSQYVIWQRIRKTMAVAIIEESKLTEACLRFGFNDQPHFNKTFKRIFGIAPFGVIRYCRVLL